MKRVIVRTAAWLILGSAGSLFAQGVQTGTLRGLVKDPQDLTIPGVTVTATNQETGRTMNRKTGSLNSGSPR